MHTFAWAPAEIVWYFDLYLKTRCGLNFFIRSFCFRESDDWAKLDENVLTSIQCLEAARQMGREFEFNELLVQLQREDEKIMPWIKKRKTDETDKKPRYIFLIYGPM